MTRLLFRADGGDKIGMGHLVRSFALATMVVVDDFEICFFCKEIPCHFLQNVRKQGFKVEHIGDESLFFKNIQKKDIVILDGYQFDAAYQQIVKSLAHSLVYIDDMFMASISADVVVNHSIGVSATDYPNVTPHTRFCLGMDYALLRKPFLNTAAQPLAQDQEDAILICFGGADSKNDTLDTLRFLENAPRFSMYYVVIGVAYKYQELLSNYLQKISLNITLLNDISDEMMVKYMQICKVAIVTPSSLSYEYLSVGSGQLFLKITAENQRHLYNQLLKKELASDISEILSFKKDRVLKKTSTKPIDGLQPKRFKQLFRGLLCQLRPATLDDAPLYWAWANEKEVREQSFNSAPISWANHSQWFAKKLHCKENYLYVAEKDGQPFGQVRFEITNETATISFSLDKIYRGQGLGTWMLETAIYQLDKTLGRKISFIGLVKHQNIASRNVFKKLGFEEVEENDALTYLLHR